MSDAGTLAPVYVACPTPVYVSEPFPFDLAFPSQIKLDGLVSGAGR